MAGAPGHGATYGCTGTGCLQAQASPWEWALSCRCFCTRLSSHFMMVLAMFPLLSPRAAQVLGLMGKFSEPTGKFFESISVLRRVPMLEECSPADAANPVRVKSEGQD